MKKVKHWLHIVLTILTSGLWLPVYVILLATTEMFNRGYREGKAAGRVARQNEIDEAHQEEKAAKLARIKQGLEERRAKSPTMRYLDLCDWRRECNPLPPTLETEYQQLRQEFGQ